MNILGLNITLGRKNGYVTIAMCQKQENEIKETLNQRIDDLKSHLDKRIDDVIFLLKK